jgi:tetratricopeptide (TPR) repeat protein
MFADKYRGHHRIRAKRMLLAVIGGAAVMTIMAATRPAMAAEATGKPATVKPASSGIDTRKEYQACMALVEVDPARALASAQYWIDQGGSFAAHHCFAAALQRQGNHRAAAIELAKLATEIDQKLGSVVPQDRAALKARSANLWMQAGQAWWLAEDNSKALAAFDNALANLAYLDKLARGAGGKAADGEGDADADADQNSAVYAQLGRALALGGLGRWQNAKQQLDAVVAAHPTLAEAWLRRAQVQRRLGQLPGAEADIAKALQLQPDEPEMLLERGAIAAASGNSRAAAADWLAVKARLAADDPLAQQAKTYLDALGQAKIGQDKASPPAPATATGAVATPVPTPPKEPVAKDPTMAP